MTFSESKTVQKFILAVMVYILVSFLDHLYIGDRKRSHGSPFEVLLHILSSSVIRSVDKYQSLTFKFCHVNATEVYFGQQWLLYILINNSQNLELREVVGLKADHRHLRTCTHRSLTSLVKDL